MRFSCALLLGAWELRPPPNRPFARHARGLAACDQLLTRGAHCRRLHRLQPPGGRLDGVWQQAGR
eukprot:526755-Prymnesium_polylepis.1